jgi:hypothetical protein
MLRFVKTAVLAATLLVASVVQANHEVNGIMINRVYIDPTDIVVMTNTNNGCGSPFFHLSRGNVNFKEMFAFIFLAFKNQTPINFEVLDTCNGDRVDISHGSMGE